MTNRKAPERRGKVQLVDAREYFVKMRKSLGEKRKEISADADRRDHPPLRRLRGGREGQDLPQRGVRLPAHHGRAPAAAAVGGHRRHDRAVLAAKAIQKLPEDVQQAVASCWRSIGALGSRHSGNWSRLWDLRLTGLGLAGPAQKAVWAALAVRDEEAPVITDRKGNPEPDPELRDNENVPLPPVPVVVRRGPDRALRDAASTGPPSMTTCATRCCRTSRCLG